MKPLTELRKEMRRLGTKKQAAVNAWFFKTGTGEYGEGDRFLGLKVPVQRTIAKKYRTLTLSDIQKLLNSPYHEERLTGVFILVDQYVRAKEQKEIKRIVDFYLKNTKRVNNWDLVDSSAPQILGDWLLDRPRSILYRLAKSEVLWEQRISILATLAFIKKGDFGDTLKLAKGFLSHSHDLIHKATGWMLREVGNRDQRTLETFLKKYAHRMPKTMLRYAIEKFSERKRKQYLAQKG